MILEDKYIVVKKNQLQSVIDVLNKNGYFFYKQYDLSSIEYDEMVLISINDKIHYFSTSPENRFLYNKKKKLDVNILLRESKLNRILKK